MNRGPASVSPKADISAVAVAAALPMLVTLVYFVMLAQQAASIQQGAYLAGKTVQFAFPLVWVLAVQRRRLHFTRPAVVGLLEGIAFGGLVLAAMTALYHGWLKHTDYLEAASGEVRQKVIGLGLDARWKYAAMGTFYAVGHSLLEEYYWRWFVFVQLRRLVRLPAVIAISSLAFMAHHVILLATFFGWWSPATALFSLCVAVGGAIWAWIYERSSSLWGPWMSHLLVDAAIFLIGYDLVAELFKS